MLTVEGIIGDLLLQHNCVIVPTFGGFVAQRVGAQLDAVNGTMTPPRKAILFNRQLINNDGLLVSSYAHQNKVDYVQAQAAVSEAVTHWDGLLKQGQRISIDRVGFLYFDQERNLCFEQDRFYNLLMESYGLGAIHFVSVADVEAKTAHTAIQEMVKEALAEPVVEFQPSQIEAVATADAAEAPIVPMNAIRKPVRVWRYAVAAALLPVAFYSFWIPMKTDVLESGVLSINDFNPFHKNAPAHYQPASATYHAKTPAAANDQLEHIPDGISIFSFSVDDDWYIPVRVQTGAEIEGTAPETQPETTVPVPVSATSGTHIIVGCFSNVNNANNLVKSLRAKGFDASVLEGNGLIRVSAGDGSQFSELNLKLQAEGLNGWVLK